MTKTTYENVAPRHQGDDEVQHNCENLDDPQHPKNKGKRESTTGNNDAGKKEKKKRSQ